MLCHFDMYFVLTLYKKFTFINKKAAYKSATVLCKNMLSEIF